MNSNDRKNQTADQATRDQLGDYLDECVRQEDDADDCDYDYDRPEPTWDAVSRHDMNEGW